MPRVVHARTMWCMPGPCGACPDHVVHARTMWWPEWWPLRLLPAVLGRVVATGQGDNLDSMGQDCVTWVVQCALHLRGRGGGCGMRRAGLTRVYQPQHYCSARSSQRVCCCRGLSPARCAGGGTVSHAGMVSEVSGPADEGRCLGVLPGGQRVRWKDGCWMCCKSTEPGIPGTDIPATTSGANIGGGVCVLHVRPVHT